MSRLPKRRFARKPKSKRFDTTGMVKTLEDLGFARGLFSAVGVVLDSDGDGSHFELDDEDLLVEVELQPSGIQLTARVSTVASGPGAGIWRVPPVGAEVLVSIPDGDLDFQPVITGWYSTGSLPEGVAEDTLVIAAPAGGTILLHDGSGDAKELVFKEAYEAHTHPTAFGPSGVANNALAAASYTAVTKAK